MLVNEPQCFGAVGGEGDHIKLRPECGETVFQEVGEVLFIIGDNRGGIHSGRLNVIKFGKTLYSAGVSSHYCSEEAANAGVLISGIKIVIRVPQGRLSSMLNEPASP